MKYTVLALPLVLLMDVIVFMNFLTWHTDSIYEFEERQLDIQVNYSIEAATQMMLENTMDLNADYLTWKNIQCDPEIAYDTYLELILRNLGWGVTDQNKQAIEGERVPFFCVCTYDGYYIAEKLEQDNGKSGKSYPLKWSIKLPYSYINGNNAYALNLDGKDAIKLNLSNCQVVKKATLPSGMGVLDVRQRIANLVAVACNRALQIGLTGQTDQAVYIPATWSSWQNTNPIQGPSCITYLKEDILFHKKQAYTFGFGSARIEEAEFVACYTYGGNKIYTYNSYNTNPPKDANGNPKTKPTTKYGNPDQIYSKPEVAAANGYWFDPYYVN